MTSGRFFCEAVLLHRILHFCLFSWLYLMNFEKKYIYIQNSMPANHRPQASCEFLTLRACLRFASDLLSSTLTCWDIKNCWCYSTSSIFTNIHNDAKQHQFFFVQLLVCFLTIYCTFTRKSIHTIHAHSGSFPGTRFLHCSSLHNSS